MRYINYATGTYEKSYHEKFAKCSTSQEEQPIKSTNVKTIEDKVDLAELLKRIQSLEQENKELKQIKAKVSTWNRRNLTV
jgi:hypothetical protein